MASPLVVFAASSVPADCPSFYPLTSTSLRKLSIVPQLATGGVSTLERSCWIRKIPDNEDLRDDDDVHDDDFAECLQNLYNAFIY